MFALLSRVDDYITADEQSTLRGLARGCMSLLKERLAVSSSEDKLSAFDEQSVIGVATCWMIITTVTGIWGQKDLWMDAEALLSCQATSEVR